MGGFVPTRPEDQAYTSPPPQPPTGNQGFVPARPEDQAFVPARPQDTAPAISPQPSLWQQIKSAAPVLTVENIKGMVKGTEKTAAQLVDMGKGYLVTGGGGMLPSSPVTIDPTGPTSRVLDTASNWLRKNTDTSVNPDQQAGDIGESVLEFLALPEMEEEKIASAIPGLADHFSSAAKLIKYLQSDAKLARVFRVGVNAVKSGIRGAAEQGAQTLVKTGGDVEQAKEAATVGGAIGGAIGGGTTAVREGREALQKLRPGTQPIAGADFPILASGNLNLASLTPGTADAATAAVDEASGNIGKTAVANSLNRSNAARPVAMARETNPARMLPAPADSAQGFRVGTTPPREVGTPPQTATVTEQTGTRTVPNPDYEAPAGELTRRPGQTEEQTAAEIGPGATTATPERSYAGPGDVDTRNPTRKRIDAARGLVPERMLVPPETVEQPVYQQRPVITQEGTQAQGGGGPLILTSDGKASSVERARAQLAQYDRVLNDPATADEMGVRQYQAITDAHADLTEQLRRYDDYAASEPNFPPHDVRAAVQSTDSLGAAGQQLKDANAPFWQKAGPEFTDLRNQEKALQNAIRSEGRTTERAGLRQQLADVQQKQLNFFDQHRTELSPEEWQTHRNGYQDGIVLSNLDDLIQDHFNGVTRPEAAASAARGGKLQRVFNPSKGFNQQLEDFYNEGTNRDVLQRTIGPDHMLDLKEIGQLFENSDRRDATKGLLDSISSAIRRHHWGIGGITGGGLAYGVTHSLGAGASVLGGAVAAGTVTGTLQYITDRLTTDPDFAKSFIYAAKNGVAPRIAGPLLASRIIQSASTQENKETKP